MQEPVNIQQAFEVQFEKLSKRPTQVLLYGAVASAIALIAGIPMSPALVIIATTIGGNLLSNMIERIGKGGDLTADDFKQLEHGLTQLISEQLSEDQFNRSIAQLVRHIDLQHKDLQDTIHRLATGEDINRILEQLERIAIVLPSGTRVFTEEWFHHQVETSIADAEASHRYIRDLNVELPIRHLFYGLGRTSEFFAQIYEVHKEFRTQYRDTFRYSTALPKLEPVLAKVKQSCENLLTTLDSVQEKPNSPLHFDKWIQLVRQAFEQINDAEVVLDEIRQNFETEKLSETSDTRTKDQLAFMRHHLFRLTDSLRKVSDLARSSEAALANMPALLLTGEGGIGKTHSFCDVARQRIERGLPTILLLGEKFRDEEPWQQVIKLLGVGASFGIDEYLAAINDFAASKNTRCLILIDALNEGFGVKLWSAHFAGMLKKLAVYRNIGIAVSVRSEYETYIIPRVLIDTGALVRYQHTGFDEVMEKAVQHFFAHYHIEYRIPPLKPEFRNPLFLLTLCRGLNNKNLRYLPTGLQGITQILKFFVDSVNERLAPRLGYNPRRHLVHDAVNALVEKIATTGTIYVPENEAEKIVNEFLPNREYENSLYRHLLAEGIITVTLFEDENTVRFLYDRFTDNLIAKYLLDSNLNPSDYYASFEENSPLGQILSHKGLFALRYSLVPAFAIQIPEQTGLELFQVAPFLDDYSLESATINSLIWRDWKSKDVPEPLLDFINRKIAVNGDTNDRFLETIISVAANPENPFNSDFLHRTLLRQELAERDAWWSLFLYYRYDLSEENESSISRLVRWAWSSYDKSHVEPEAIRLVGITLAWFLCSSNRFLRDGATKALVSVFTPRIPILITVLHQFLGVNDPYVLERLFAVAYGCAMRSTDLAAIELLATHVYGWVFQEGNPSPHILLRDYARGVVEVGYKKCPGFKIDIARARPPYKSERIIEPPSETDLESLYGTYPDNLTTAERAMRTIHHSVMGWDFSRYIINKVEHWTTVPLTDPTPLTPKETYDQFFKSFTPEKLVAWEQFINQREESTQLVKEVLENWDDWKEMDEQNFTEALQERLAQSGYDLSELNNTLNQYLSAFIEGLSDSEKTEYEASIHPYVIDSSKLEKTYYQKTHFDVSFARRWILQRVFELGWTTERFGDFDFWVDRSGIRREAKKTERIGKKYQWLAFHELLARVSDNYYYRSENWEAEKSYLGTWQIGVRDIDPSILISKTHRNSDIANWWFKVVYKSWDTDSPTATWVKDETNLPEPHELIEVVDPSDNSVWYNMDTMFDWEEPTPPIEDKYEKPRRRLWYMIKSYLVAKSDADTFFDWAKDQDFMGRWMPESHDVYALFFGEFFWSPAYQYYRNPMMDYQEWERGSDQVVPVPISVTVDDYVHEDHYDCSMEETIGICVPSKWLADQMHLDWKGNEGQYYDVEGNIVARDPSVSEVGPSTLLVSRDKLVQFLKDNQLEVVWTLLGEKALVGDWSGVQEWQKINGVYRLSERGIDGTMHTLYEERPSN